MKRCAAALFAGLLLLAAPLLAAALTRRPPHQFPRHHSMAGRDRANFHHSGTRGRVGLGANPHRPEGPGNVSFSR
jgi:hypothetical protein